jgi:dihydroxyacetone kinase-like predicted kinase
MKQAGSWNGKDLRDMFAAGSNWLEKSVAEINAINVFPVPDGDTGTNMLLTLRSVIEEADRAADISASTMSKAMSHGALLGARGNSGVILAQIFRGFARGFDSKAGQKLLRRQPKRRARGSPTRLRAPYSPSSRMPLS